MADSTGRLVTEFGRCAGAGFVLAGLRECYADEDESLRSPLLLWLLSCQAMVLCETAADRIAWLDQQVRHLAADSHAMADELKRRIAESWTVWLAFALLPAPEEQGESWSAYCSAFPLPEEGETLRQVTGALLRNYGTGLFDAEGLDEKHLTRFPDPSHRAIIRLGMTLTEVSESHLPERLASWRDTLRERVLKRLPEPVSRGFAPESPGFEDLTLSLLHVADWLSQPELDRIASYIESCAEYSGEALTLDQKAFCLLLFGWQCGYSKVAGRVRELPLRSVLARQAAIIAQRRFEGEGAGVTACDLVLRATQDGRLERLLWPLLRVTRYQRETRHLIERRQDGPQGEQFMPVVEEHTTESAELVIHEAGLAYRYLRDSSHEGR